MVLRSFGRGRPLNAPAAFIIPVSRLSPSSLQPGLCKLPHMDWLARLGNVLYWLGCIAAVALIGLAVWIWVDDAQGGTAIVFGTLGVIAWLIGSVCRYALTAD
jgi:hypothetical protein